MRLSTILISVLALFPTACLGTSVPASTVPTVASTNPQPIPQKHSFALPQTDLQVLKRHARNITVKVMSDNNWGSGILIQRKGQIYTVLTNEHVLWIGDRYTIQTSDGKQYTAKREAATAFGKNDLGLLRFTSENKDYPIATLGCSLRLTKGTPVYASGFPLPLNEQSTKGFKFTKGSISMISAKAFEGGYQVGYSNDIEKGMSGGPVLNAKGEVVAVNGMHQEPLWGDPYIFQDGTKPKSALFETLSHSSWAIPVETAVHTNILRSMQLNQCKQQ